MIRFKDGNEKLRDQFWEITSNLRLILCYADIWLQDAGYDCVVTSLLRSDGEQLALYQSGQTKYRTSVHQFGRGADLRATAPNDTMKKLVAHINRKFVYDYSRRDKKTALFHGGTALHLHLQSMT